MNILLWVLQILAALVYGASGVMKAFMFDEVTAGSSPSARCRGKSGSHSASSSSCAWSA
jgi:Na+-transporting methylmalonyl-CoA/oxaloacetate decarboxylase gamma subunit